MGPGGNPDIFWIEILTFLGVNSPCKILEPYNNPFWKLRNGAEKEKVIPKIVAFLSCSAGCSHFTRTSAAEYLS